MIHTITVECEIVNDRIVRLGCTAPGLDGWVVVALLQQLCHQLTLAQLVNALGGPRRQGGIELPRMPGML